MTSRGWSPCPPMRDQPRQYHPDQTVLDVLRCSDGPAAIAIGCERGVSAGMALKWWYRREWRAIRIAAEHGLPRNVPGDRLLPLRLHDRRSDPDGPRARSPRGHR